MLAILCLLCYSIPVHSWGFFGHRRINYYAVFLLPPEMLLFFKPHIGFLEEHAVDPDKRRYMVPQEGPRHYIDMDKYGTYPYDSLPRKWKDAVAKYGADSLQTHGIVPWWVQTMLQRLTDAFKSGNHAVILKTAAELGHYIGDAHVPLHTSSNHNGQYTDQRGIHGFWESRIPELLADKHWDFFIGKAIYITHPSSFIWSRILESAAASDTVLRFEKELSLHWPVDRRYGYEERNGILVRQYSTAYARAYDQLMLGMVERRMRASIFATASFWYTAWVNAGQPDLSRMRETVLAETDRLEFEALNEAWRKSDQKEEHH